MTRKGTPDYLRSDIGSEFIAKHLRKCAFGDGSGTDVYYAGEPMGEWVCRINGTMANELLNREIFDTIHEARVLLARWVREYNTKRPHSALGYRPPAPEAVLWAI